MSKGIQPLKGFRRYWQGFRSLIFYLGFVPTISLFSLLACLFFFLPLPQRQSLATCGNLLAIKWLGLTCGIKLVVEGRENIPRQPCVFLSNHQSTWETFFLQRELRPVCTILKKELLRIPIFGWGLATTHPIAIDRSNPRDAMRQVLAGGKQRLAAGNSVIVYPQGTRTPLGETRPFARSGAALALDAGVPIVPVAHNAGAHWPNKAFIKYPGILRVTFGSPIISGRDSKQVTSDVEEWINRQLTNFSAG